MVARQKIEMIWEFTYNIVIVKRHLPQAEADGSRGFESLRARHIDSKRDFASHRKPLFSLISPRGYVYRRAWNEEGGGEPPPSLLAGLIHTYLQSLP